MIHTVLIYIKFFLNFLRHYNEVCEVHLPVLRFAFWFLHKFHVSALSYKVSILIPTKLIIIITISAGCLISIRFTRIFFASKYAAKTYREKVCSLSESHLSGLNHLDCVFEGFLFRHFRAIECYPLEFEVIFAIFLCWWMPWISLFTIKRTKIEISLVNLSKYANGFWII